jgi:L-arabinokinase
MKKIAYYITAHGYGHGTRSCDILNALRAADPDIPIIVKTDLPVDFMGSRLSNDISLCQGAFDVGLIQKDSIHVDLDASIQEIEQLYARETELIAQERIFMQEENIGVVVADIPAIPLAAAQQAGLSNIGCANFGWDWIYSDFIDHDPRWKIYVDKFRKVYKKTDLLLRQPFAEPMAAFPNQIDLPLLANPGTARRELIADKTGADPTKTWVLLSFTTLNLTEDALQNFAQLKQYELFSVEPLEWPESTVRSISRSDVSFADILASSDAVVTKPGFGIVSECIANNKPIIYSERENFKEYPVLVSAIKRFCRQAFIPNTELYAGKLERALKAIERAPEAPEKIKSGGAEQAAYHILQRIQNTL